MLALIFPVQKGYFFFSYSYEETKHLLDLTYSHSSKLIFPDVFFFVFVPLHSHFPAAGTSGSCFQGSPTYWAHIQLFCWSGDINAGIFGLSVFAGRVGKEWKEGEIVKRREIQPVFAHLCPWFIMEVRQGNSCVRRRAAQAPPSWVLCFAHPTAAPSSAPPLDPSVSESTADIP